RISDTHVNIAAADHSCGVHVFQYFFGPSVGVRASPQNSSGGRRMGNVIAAWMTPLATRSASTAQPYWRRPATASAESNGHTEPSLLVSESSESFQPWLCARPPRYSM